MAHRAAKKNVAGVMILSAVPSTYQDGMVCQAGTPDGSLPALKANGRWVAYGGRAVRVGTPLAKDFRNTPA